MDLIPNNLSIDFVGKRKFFLTLSLVVNVAILVGIAIFGFNWGVDFAGGSEIEVKFAQAVNAGDLRKVMEDAGFEDASVQEVGPASENSFLIRVGRVGLMTQDDAAKAKSALDAKFAGQLASFEFDPEFGDKIELRFKKDAVPPKTDVQAAIESTGLHVNEMREVGGGYSVITRGISDKVAAALEEAKAKSGMPQAELRRVEYVGPQVGRELRNKGLLSIVYASLAILAYVALRFDTRFAPGAIIAMVHDIIIVLGYYLITRREFSLTSVAVVLTIVGYSVNDTIVIYDRIREDLGKMKGMALPALINVAINETLSRTILTGSTSMLAVTGLLIFGVGGIWDFAMAMIIGIMVGTYSSIYIASPTTIWLEEVFSKKGGQSSKPPVAA